MNNLDILHTCLANRELIQQFDRLNGTNLSRRGSPIERMVDDGSGRTEADLAAFVEFVVDCVISRLTPPEGA